MFFGVYVLFCLGFFSSEGNYFIILLALDEGIRTKTGVESNLDLIQSSHSKILNASSKYHFCYDEQFSAQISPEH